MVGVAVFDPYDSNQGGRITMNKREFVETHTSHVKTRESNALGDYDPHDVVECDYCGRRFTHEVSNPAEIELTVRGHVERHHPEEL